MQTHLRHSPAPRSLLWPWIGLGLGLGLALLLAIAWLQAPAADLLALLTSLLATGLASLVVGAVWMRWLRRGTVPIWIQVTLTYLFGVAVALCNIVVTAQLMFLSTHDLPLLVLLILAAAIIAIGLGIALARVFAQRVSDLHHTATTLARGDLSVRVAATGDDELAALARSFNHMADQLEAAAVERVRQEQLRHELIVAISHDVRTPLASLRAMTEALADGVVDDPETTARYYDTMRGQIGQMTQLVEDLFSLARLEAGTVELDMQPVAIDGLIADVLAAHSPQAAAKDIQLEADIAPELKPALIAPQQILRVLDNILVNALRHTPQGGRIGVRVTPLDAEEQLAIEVVDTGEGIVAEDLPRVFERFYRGEKSRARASGGAGLGLAIARGIVDAHGGTITIASTPGEGTCVRFTVKAAATV